MEDGKYFSTSDDDVSAYSLVYSYLDESPYKNDDSLKKQLDKIIGSSLESQLQELASNLGLSEVENDALDKCAQTMAEDCCKDPSSVEDEDYGDAFVENNEDVQKAIAKIPSEDCYMHRIFGEAMTAEEFSNKAKEKISEENEEDLGKLYYSGVGRYYDEEEETFYWGIILIYAAKS